MRDYSFILGIVDKARKGFNDKFKNVVELSKGDDVEQLERTLNQAIIDLRVQLYELEHVQERVNAELKKQVKRKGATVLVAPIFMECLYQDLRHR